MGSCSPEHLKNLTDEESKKNVQIQTVSSKSSKSSVNPNILFFCQIVALIIPISVLYGGLYFTSSTTSIIAVVCGAMVLTLLCITIVSKPFSTAEEIEEEDKISMPANLTPTVAQVSEAKFTHGSEKSAPGNILQKLFSRSKTRKSRNKKIKKLRTMCSRESSQARPTPSEHSHLSDAEEGKCLLGPPCISSGSDDERMDLLNMDEKVLTRHFLPPSSLQNLENKLRELGETKNSGFSGSRKELGTSKMPNGALGRIEEEENSSTIDDSSSSAEKLIDDTQPMPRNFGEPRCEKGEECILIRLFPKSSKVGAFELEQTPESPWLKTNSPDRNYESTGTCVTPKEIHDAECQTLNCNVDASCDVIFVNETKNSESQTLKYNLVNDNTAVTALQQPVEELKLCKPFTPISKCHGKNFLSSESKSCLVDEVVRGEGFGKLVTSKEDTVRIASNLSIVDFVLRGHCSPGKLIPESPTRSHAGVVASKKLETTKSSQSIAKDKRYQDRSAEVKINLELAGSGATVSSYHTSGDWWHAADSLENTFLTPHCILMDGKPQIGVLEDDSQNKTQSESLCKNVQFQPRKFGLLATESSIEDVRQTEQRTQINKNRSNMYPTTQTEKHDFTQAALPLQRIKPSDLCSPPRKVQRKVSSPYKSPKREKNQSANNATFFRIHSAVGTTAEKSQPPLNRPPKPPKLDFFPEIRKAPEISSSRCAKNDRHKFFGDSVTSQTKHTAIFSEDSSDVSLFSNSAPNDRGSGDGRPGKSKTRNPNGKKGVSRFESTIVRKSSSSFDNVIIERVLKQKKKTLKKFT